MPLLATFTDLIKGCPRNIKRRLLRDILLILFVTTGAILTLVFAQGMKTRRDISSAIIAETSKSVTTHYHSFAEPLNNVIFLLAKLGESGLLKPAPPEPLAAQFQAMMELHPAIKAISLAHTVRDETQLVHDRKQWILHQHSQGKSSRSQWTGDEIIFIDEQLHSAYQPGASTWYRGAKSAPSGNPPFLSQPQLLEGTGKSIITASLRWYKREDPDTAHVSAISFSLEDFLTFMAQLETTPKGQVMLLRQNGSLLSNLTINNLSPESSTSSAPALLSAQLLEMAHEQLTSTQDSLITSFKNKGKTWWLGLNPLASDENDVWAAVLIPEADIFIDLQRQWLRFGLIAGFFLLLATITTFSLIRRYSHQLRELPQQKINSNAYQSEIDTLIKAGESSTLEFKSTMRTNLKNGKRGKEIELAWLKAVVAFMNSDGGILLIGVADDGTLLGIDADNFDSEDKCRLHFKNLLNTHIGAEFTRFVHLKVISIKDKTILIVECERVRRPVFLRVGSNEDFFIRSGPSSMKLSMSQMVKYLAER
ncbi:MAG: RNA-binding domain-containing protein [Thermodesulfobacteriota bacterium]